MPPQASPDDLIEVWTPNMEFEGEHATDIDVTGGIGLKATRRYDCCKRYRCRPNKWRDSRARFRTRLKVNP